MADEQANMAPTAAAATATVPLLQVICFSMDRVFQLSEYLRTLQRYVRYRGTHWMSTPTTDDDDDSNNTPFARVAVICRCTTAEIRAHYDQIAQRYAAHGVTFVYESETQSFADCLLLSLATGGQRVGDSAATATATAAASCPYVLFNVDDAFYFDDVELADAFAFLDGETCGSAAIPFAFHVKLAPSIWRSHLTNQPMLPLPPMQTVMRRVCGDSGDDDSSSSRSSSRAATLAPAYHVFEPARGVLDWNYPWELSGSVYARASVERVVAAIQETFGQQGINHPNHLELRGHQVLQAQMQQQHSKQSSSIAQRLLCACSLSPKMHVFAINQVQDVFQNRLYEYDDTLNDGTSSSGDLTNLLQLYLAHETLNERFYRCSRLASVHIGTLVLQARASAPGADAPASPNVSNPLVSVVIPAFNVAAYIEQALRSVMQQTYTNLEIVVIDDASTDTTHDIVAALQAQDARIQLLRNDVNIGVAASLNRALAAAHGAFVARMDGDDVSLLHRIERQLNYLQEHPEVSIVGASVLILREHERPDPHVQQLETAVYPTSPLVTKWRMLFGCFVGHPTVMLRREALTTLAASEVHEWYSTSQRSSEDYELWLRCLYGHDLAIQSMGDALVIHRKHTRNISSVRREQQIRETQAIALKWIESLVAPAAATGLCISNNTVSDVPGTQLLPLFDVSASDSVEDLHTCINALHALQTEVCASVASASSPQPQAHAHVDERECERAYICQDAASREGELALHAMVLDPIRGAQLWSSFAARHPQASRSAFEKLFRK